MKMRSESQISQVCGRKIDWLERLSCFAGAHSVMIATAAESNPTCFDPKPLVDLEGTLLPPYVQLVRCCAM